MFGGTSSARSVAAMVATVGSLACLAGPAQAYDRGSCEQKLGAANVEEVDTIGVNVGKVDFGDHLHLSGTPLGDAVVCWGENGNVAIVGRLFADSSTWTLAKARITVFTAGGSASTPRDYSIQGRWAQSTVISEVLGMHPGPVTRVQIQLYSDGVLRYTRGERRGA